MDRTEVILLVFVSVGVLGVVIIGILLGKEIAHSYGNFEYETFAGETGQSDHCYESRGTLFCVKDGGKIQVQRYKEVKNETTK